MKDRLTQFGVKCREFRTRYGLIMSDQAKGLGLSAAYISAIERGKRPIPEDYASKLSEWMSLSQEDSQILRELASGERSVVKLYPKNRQQALLAEEFAQDLNGLTPEFVGQLREVLRTARSGKYSDDEIRKRAYLARAAFSLGNQISFNILRIVESYLPAIDPNFSLQIDPDGTHGENLHIFSDSDGKTIERFVTTDWLYEAADRETDDSRFKLAHELAHWILHRTESLTFLRSGRTNKILSKLHLVAEKEADFFAREFLMPLPAVEKFTSAEALAKSARVPLWVAKARLRDIERLTEAERERIRRHASKFEEASELVLEPTNLSVEGYLFPQEHSAAILPFPRNARLRSPRKERRKAASSLPLFDYVQARPNSSPTDNRNRSDKWFADFGWRG